MSRRQSASLSCQRKFEMRRPHKTLVITKAWLLREINSALAMMQTFSFVFSSKFDLHKLDDFRAQVSKLQNDEGEVLIKRVKCI